MEVATAITFYQNDREYEDLVYNLLPSLAEVGEAIENKSNGKSTMDIKNEMLKRPGEKMTKFIYPIIERIWEQEEVPKEWNTGQIKYMERKRPQGKTRKSPHHQP